MNSVIEFKTNFGAQNWPIRHIEHLNTLNTSMQGKRKNLFMSVDKICAMRDKITIWIREVKKSNLESFPKLQNAN